MEDKKILLDNIDKIHTTETARERVHWERLLHRNCIFIL